MSSGLRDVGASSLRIFSVLSSVIVLEGRTGRPTAEPEFPSQIRDAARAAWHRYIDFLTPFRPDLFKYCRRLTSDVWDAEDLVQDTMVRGFGVLNHVQRAINNPRGYLIRIASNLWLDAMRRRTSEAQALALEGNEARIGFEAKPDTIEVRDAAARLMQMLAPQERAALVLKEVFDMSLDEIAEILGTSVGAVKAALHRGRSLLEESIGAQPPWRPMPSAALVERFVERLNASDLPSLLALMLDSATIDMLGNLVEVGRKEFESKGSWLWQSVNVHPDLPAQLRPPKFVNERATFKGEPMLLGFMVHGDSKLLMAVVRFEEEDGRISRIRAYNFSNGSDSGSGCGAGSHGRRRAVSISIPDLSRQAPNGVETGKVPLAPHMRAFSNSQAKRICASAVAANKSSTRANIDGVGPLQLVREYRQRGLRLINQAASRTWAAWVPGDARPHARDF